MRIKLFERLFKRSEPADSVKIKEQKTVKANTTGIATVRDSFVKARSDNYFSGKLLESGDLQKEQEYGRKQNDDVLVEFQAGEKRSPYLLGGLWSSDKPPETKSDSDDDDKKKKD